MKINSSRYIYGFAPKPLTEGKVNYMIISKSASKISSKHQKSIYMSQSIVNMI